MLKRFFSVFLALIITICVFPTKILAESTPETSDPPSEVTEYATKDVKESYFDDNGNQILVLDDGSFVIRDYSHELTDVINPIYTKNNTRKVRSVAGFILVAKAVLKVAGYVILACDVIRYATVGKDVCLEVIKYVKDSFDAPPAGDYGFYGKYVQKRIPGCEPMHSAQCNGYWEYIVKKL